MGKTTHHASSTIIQNNFGSFVSQVVETSQPVFVERHGRPVAVLVSFRKWQEQTGKEKSHQSTWVESCKKLSAAIKKRRPKMPGSPAVTLIRQLRDEA